MSRPTKGPHTILLDSDIVAYQFSAKNEKTYDFGDKTNAVKHFEQDIEGVMADCLARVDDIKSRIKADEVIVCLSCPTSENFRLKILPTYKGNRDPAAKPLQLTLVKQRLAAAYPSYERPTLEADDIMGILSTHPSIVKGRRTIVSEDKDMQTIPGALFNPRKDTKVRTITAAMADRYHLYQTLIGDATDHYSGCPGMGPEKAEEFLREPYELYTFNYTFKSGPRKGLVEQRYGKAPASSVWGGIVSLYRKAGLTEEDALVQARVARILRHTDYDFDKKEPILWTPIK